MPVPDHVPEIGVLPPGGDPELPGEVRSVFEPGCAPVPLSLELIDGLLVPAPEEEEFFHGWPVFSGPFHAFQLALLVDEVEDVVFELEIVGVDVVLDELAIVEVVVMVLVVLVVVDIVTVIEDEVVEEGHDPHGSAGRATAEVRSTVKYKKVIRMV